MTDNVTPFPGFKGYEKRTIPEGHYDPEAAIDDIWLVHIEACMEPIINLLLTQVQVAGYEIVGGDVDCRKDIAMVATAVRALMMRPKGIPHPFHRIAAEVFKITPDGFVELTYTDEEIVT